MLNLSGILKIAVLLALWSLVFAPVVPQMVKTWFEHSDNSHAILVPFISLFFGWTKRQEIAAIELSGSVWGGVFLVLCLTLYLLSYIGDIAFVARLMLVGSLISMAWNCYGWPILRVFAFPLGFLFFVVPVPITLLNFATLPLQMLVTRASIWIIHLFSIPAYREGNMIYFVQAQLEIAEACSGIRSIISLLMLNIVLAYLTRGRRYRKIIFVACAIPMAMLANTIRVSGTGILAHFFGDEVARGFLHDFSGITVFAFGLAVMVLLSRPLGLTFHHVSKSSIITEH
jgi:exosortase